MFNVVVQLFFTFEIITIGVISVNGNEFLLKCPPPLENCENNHLKYYLYTDNVAEPQRLNVEDEQNISNALFKTDCPIKIIYPEYDGGRDSPLMARLREEYLLLGIDMNVLVVDYTNIADESCYKETFLPSAQVIGKCTAELIDKILEIKLEKKDIDRMHAIGFGLGSHIAAITSINLDAGNFVRITGLDPANVGYIFSAVPNLNKEHANFVDIYHTNIGWHGTTQPAGHIDIYFNGGYTQPKCLTNNICSHKIVVAYYILTINPQVDLRAIKCSFMKTILKLCPVIDPLNEISVGEYMEPVPEQKQGVYAAYTTNNRPPKEDMTMNPTPPSQTEEKGTTGSSISRKRA